MADTSAERAEQLEAEKQRCKNMQTTAMEYCACLNYYILLRRRF
jgi:hypothetical protein